MGEYVYGVFFASLRLVAKHAAGYGRVRYYNQKTRPGIWMAQLRSWQTTIQNLAEEFEQGRAARTPLPNACDYCEIKPVCRIEEDRRRRGAGEGE